MKEKQQQLLFDKGITNVPSDAICSDNALSESVGMVYDNGEHRVIQKPADYINGIEGGGTYTAIPHILLIHKFNDEERFIAYVETSVGTPMLWGTREGTTLVHKGYLRKRPGNKIIQYGDSTKVTTIGKTLIISDEEGIHYFIWNDDEYKSLGEIPEADIEFWLEDWKKNGRRVDRKLYVSNSGSCESIISDESIAKQEDYNNLVAGLYAKNKKSVSRNKGFCTPFFIRTAIRLYDDTYTHISQPILLFPSVTANTDWFRSGEKVIASTYYEVVKYANKSDFSGWEDVVKGITVFVSDGIEIYDISEDQPYEVITRSEVVANMMTRTFDDSEKRTRFVSVTKSSGFKGLKLRDPSDLFSDIAATSVFYKLGDISAVESNAGDEKDLGSLFHTNTLENITTQQILEYDDYYSRSRLFPNFVYSYNSRLNIANVSRGFFEGFGFFMPNDNTSVSTYDYYVTIKTDNGDRVVHHTEIDTKQKQGIYFYYPDSRAKSVIITRTTGTGTKCVLNAELKEHEGLNGAYYFSLTELDGYNDSQLSTYFDETEVDMPSIPEVNDEPEVLANYILTSEVNNPWVFKAEGYNNVGTGKIIGLSSITQALSEGQFGQFPLLAFSESGIWSLSVASTGYYSTIHPMSREVALEENPCITQTDGAVFFASKKGLMMIVGSQVKCVSEQLSGKDITFAPGDSEMTNNLGNFCDYLRNAFIAYDYRDSLLWILNSGYNTCWVYSIKSATFGKYCFGSRKVGQDMKPVVPIHATNNYPDYLVQTSLVHGDYGSDNYIYSLMERPDINLDTTNTYSGRIITRPMKLENSLALKSIMRIVNFRDMNDDGNIKLSVYASNNMKDWVLLRSLRGTPWIYYRFVYDFSGLLATDRFSGSVLVTQERRTDKPRRY